jgi:hypothetical protein
MSRLGESQRRRLALRCREHRIRALVLDEILMLYLLSRPSDRLATFFQCTIPFSFSEPYDSRPGYVPPELFYGRAREQDAITDLNGSCFVFGGRQLGKTALLRKVEAEFSDLERGHAAVYIDLRSNGIGGDRHPDAVWGLVASELKKRGVLTTDVPSGAQPERVSSVLRRWIDQDARRRLLLLLDEADDFFQQDAVSPGTPFGETSRLKALMDATGRRFKVVFAGLHNVQRATTLANHPLAHFGEPVCIGPLFANEEWKEAQSLVEQPMRAAGYHFDDQMLVWRILAQVNYYPSLIQLYCARLFEHVNQSVSWDPARTPPYIIADQHVRDAYQSEDLRDQIRERFRWTLELDARYQAIALCIANRVVRPDGHSAEDALSMREIRQETAEWWPGGLEDLSPDAFRALLEEMVGLGTLRRVNGDRYTLRGENVALLIGTPREIEDQLLTLPPADVTRRQTDLSTLRRGRRTTDPQTVARRCPLTARQELELQRRESGVTVLFTAAAAGQADLRPFLEEMAGADYFEVVGQDIQDRAHFQTWLESVLDRSVEGVTTCLVPADVPWSEFWIDDAVARVEKARRRTRFVRVVFIADPAAAWRLARAWRPLSERFGDRIASVSLGPWHDSMLQPWLDQLGVPVANAQEELERIRRLTGLWPALLYQVVEGMRGGVRRQHLAGALDAYESAVTGKAQPATRQALGLDVAEPARVLTTLAQLGHATLPELADMFDDGTEADVIEDALTWGRLLGLVRERAHGVWEVEPTVGRAAALGGA